MNHRQRTGQGEQIMPDERPAVRRTPPPTGRPPSPQNEQRPRGEHRVNHQSPNPQSALQRNSPVTDYQQVFQHEVRQHQPRGYHSREPVQSQQPVLGDNPLEKPNPGREKELRHERHVSRRPGDNGKIVGLQQRHEGVGIPRHIQSREESGQKSVERKEKNSLPISRPAGHTRKNDEFFGRYPPPENRYCAV